MLLMIKSNHGDESKSDPTVVKSGDTENVKVTFKVTSFFPFITEL